MNELNGKQKAFVVYAAEVLDASTGEDLDKKLQSISQDELTQLISTFEEVYNKGQEPISAKLGAKLDYINKLNGKCPDGYELQTFMHGGVMHKGCRKCLNKPIPKDKKGSVIAEIKNDIAKKKKGGKAKMMQDGGQYSEPKHAAMLKAYKEGKLNPKDLPQLQKYNRTSGHHNDGWSPSDSTSTKKVDKKVDIQKPKKAAKKLNGGLINFKKLPTIK